MQYKVPQNVDIEDKVIGPLTIRQFIILLVAAGILMILNQILVEYLRIFFFVAVIIIGGGALALAFAKYGDQNAEVFLLSAWKTFINPQARVWRKEEEKEEKEPQQKEIKKDSETPEDKRVGITEARSNLEKLAEVVDSGGFSVVEKGDTDMPDILAETERPNENVEKMIASAQKSSPKREQLVSEAASVTPDRTQAETPKIKLRKDQYYKNVK
ncbi:MAG: PrgI family protein [Patescibacteria group bacterium]|nr:PrgI family protein [Patescibacteria group bacterium]